MSKLYYFAIRGLAEPIRMLFTDQQIPFEDITFLKNEEWFKMKETFAFGQVPCLKEDGMEIPQSGAILRHLARKHNLDGQTEQEKTFADFFAEGIKDLHLKYTKMIYQEYEKKDEFLAEVYPAEWKKVESLLKKHNDGKEFVLGGRISYADYMLFEELDIALILSPTVLDQFPTLKAFHQRFSLRPNLKEYLANRKLPVNNNGKQ